MAALEPLTQVFTIDAAGFLAVLDEMAQACTKVAGQIDLIIESADRMAAGVSAAADEMSAGADTGSAGMDRLTEATDAVAESQSAVRDAIAENTAAFERQGAAVDALVQESRELAIAVDEASTAIDEQNAALDTSIARTSETGDAAAAFGGRLKLAFLGIVAGGAIAVHMAGDFQQQMERLVTSAGESQKNLKMVSDGILAMSSATNTSTTQLAQGMYYVESAGYHGAQGLTVLRAAAQGAQAEGADMTTVANALTTALNAYHLPASKAVAVTDQMVTAVAHGKMNLQDFASSLSSVLPYASAVHLSFSQVAGAMATMTAQGQSAQESAFLLRHTISALSGPNSVAIAEMQQLGINSNQLAKNLGKAGLTGTINELQEAVLKNMGPSGMVLLKAFNQSKLAAQSANEMIKAMPPSIAKLAEAYQNGSLTAQQWQKIVYSGSESAASKNLLEQFASVENASKGFNNQLKAGGGNVQTYLASLSKMMGGMSGTQVALMVGGAHAAVFNRNVKAIAASADHAGKNVNNWKLIQKEFNFQLGSAEKALEATAIKFGTVLLPAVTRALQGLNHFLTGLMKNKTEAGALAVVLGSVVAVAIERKLVSSIHSAMSAFGDLWKAAGKVASGLGKLPGIISKIPGAVRAAGSAISGAWSKIGSVTSSVLSGISRAASATWSAISSGASAAWSGISSGISTAVTAVKEWSIWSKIAAAATKVWTGVQAAFDVVMDANPVALVIIAIAALVAAIVVLAVKFRPVRDFFKEAWHDISAWAVDAWHAVAAAFTGLWHDVTRIVGDVINWVKGHWPLVVGIFLGPIALVVAEVIRHWHQITEWTERLWHDVVSIVSRLWHDVTGFFGQLVDSAVRLAEELWQREVAGWERIWHDVVQIVTRLVHDVISWFGQLPGRILHAVASFGTLLVHAGEDLLRGLISGIKSMVAPVLNLVGGIGHDIGGVFSSILKMASPSKVFFGFGQNIVAGLAQGISASKPEAVAAASSLASSTAYAAQSAATKAADKLKTMREIGLGLRAGIIAGLTGTASDVKSAVEKLAEYISEAVGVGDISDQRGKLLTDWLERDNTKLQRLATERDKILKRIQTADKYAQTTTQNTESWAGISNLATVSAASNGGALYSGDILAEMKQNLSTIHKFEDALKKLKKLGLDRNILNQLIQMGPQQGLQVATALLDGPVSVIKQLDQTQTSIDKSSKQLGKSAAEDMYDVGKHAGQGFLKGLEDQQKALERIMERIAKAMIRTIRRELGIHSPSTVGAWHGRMFAEGIAQGIDEGESSVVSSARRLTGALRAESANAGAAGAGAGGGNVYNFSPRIEISGVVASSKRDMEMVLQPILQEAFLKYQKRNPAAGNGLSLTNARP